MEKVTVPRAKLETLLAQVCETQSRLQEVIDGNYKNAEPEKKKVGKDAMVALITDISPKLTETVKESESNRFLQKFDVIVSPYVVKHVN